MRGKIFYFLCSAAICEFGVAIVIALCFKPVESMDEIWAPSEKTQVEHMLQFAGGGSKESVCLSAVSFFRVNKGDELIVSMPIHDSEAKIEIITFDGEVRERSGCDRLR